MWQGFGRVLDNLEVVARAPIVLIGTTVPPAVPFAFDTPAASWPTFVTFDMAGSFDGVSSAVTATLRARGSFDILARYATGADLRPAVAVFNFLRLAHPQCQGLWTPLKFL